jgi:hypothetical protein
MKQWTITPPCFANRSVSLTMPFGTMTWNSALPYRNPATVARLVGSQSRPRRPAARYRPGEAGGLAVIQGKKRLGCRAKLTDHYVHAEPCSAFYLDQWPDV